MPPTQFGRYEIVEELRRGGMAAVYRAYDPRFEREVALKVLPPQLLHDATFEARFKREAKVIATLEHPAIVPVHDFGEENGQPYLVMRLMSGGSLADRLHHGPLTLEQTSRVIGRVAEALDQAHAKGIVHRDLKPGNILFDEQGNAYLSDFGISKLIQTSTPLTESNVIIGTPAYMSPEQGRGERDIDGRSDVYSLGALLYEMLSGRLPYESETPTGQIIKHITDPIPNLLAVCQGLPPGVQRVLERAMAKRREDRYTKASELAQALKALAAGQPLPAAAGAAVSPAPAARPLPAAPLSRASQATDRPTQPTPLPRPAARKLPGWLLPAIGGGGLLMVLLVIVVVAGLVLPGMMATPTVTSLPAASDTPQPGATLTSPPTEAPTAAPTQEATPFAYSGSSIVAARASPSEASVVLDWLSEGAKVMVIGRSEDGQWLQVRLPGRQVGWVLASAVTFSFDLNQIPVPTPLSAPTLTPTAALLAAVASPAANLRSGPGTNYPSLSSLTEGTEVQVSGRSADGKWLAVWLPDLQLNGWMALSTLAVSFDVEPLAVIEAPPSPTPPPYTPPTPTEKEDGGNKPPDTPAPTTYP